MQGVQCNDVVSARVSLSLSADWSTCQLSERAVCGNGIKTRMLDCVRSDGKSVDLKFCKEVSPEALPVADHAQQGVQTSFIEGHIQ